MTEHFSEDEVVTTVTRLTRSQLVSFIKGGFVKPQQEEDRYVFRRIDIARLELLCDLSHDLELDETVLGVVISLLDQLHEARQDLSMMTRAIDILPAEVRADIEAALKRS
ncbi:chaperone modulatory protein CbpM [Jannaschia faecimaris]|uniref:Chaperone modulatory protein CbpM n=1 Tax=Jannaschia faecimaris TaxID=1244108 RepID=A0A1H3SBS4_9RHOB|nr:chaperone modulator CbpM [Jannaschia faecimaris]SDZ35167.1 chaperone modulatory protein CbpM [Jannaschia faecimaris]